MVSGADAVKGMAIKGATQPLEEISVARMDDREENRRIFRQMQIDAATRFMRKWNQEMAAMTLDQILDSHPDGRAWEAYYKALRARLAEVPNPVPSKRSRR